MHPNLSDLGTKAYVSYLENTQASKKHRDRCTREIRELLPAKRPDRYYSSILYVMLKAARPLPI